MPSIVTIKAGGPGFLIGTCTVWRDERGRYRVGCIAHRMPRGKTMKKGERPLPGSLRTGEHLTAIARRMIERGIPELVLTTEDYEEIAPGVRLRARLEG